jgi:hypothetical protein
VFHHIHQSLGHVQIFRFTDVVFVYVELLFTVNDHHIGGVASYRYVHVIQAVGVADINQALNLILISDVKLNQVL